VVVAANRDEYLDRPATPPGLLAGGDGMPVVAPRDLRAGGTWLGLNGAGVFAALTNRPTKAPDPSRRSRGLLVLDALAESTAEASAKRLASLPSGDYNPFNLVVADRQHAFAIVYDDAPRLTTLRPGAHVIGNADPDDVSVPKVARLLERAERAGRARAEEVLPILGEICRGHDGQGAPLEDACIHTPVYGTRSSALLHLGDRAGTDRFRFADGPPCRAEYEDYTHLLSALGRTTVASPGARIARTPS
jgi:uncharacterized protein with NRDE domain